MTKIVSLLTILILFSLALNIYQFKINNENLKLSINLCNSKASTLLFAIESNQTDIVKDILKSDLVQLIHDYDSTIFKKSKILSSVCSDWEKIIKRPVVNYLDKHKGKDSEYFDKVKNNYEYLHRRCEKKGGARSFLGIEPNTIPLSTQLKNINNLTALVK